jgi:uncharacterized DUF497 family protein
MGLMKYLFEWDPQKAKSNEEKHGVTFEHAATVFRDSRAISIFDLEHGADEERWLTLGISAAGTLIVVHHTFNQIDGDTAVIRIISSRKATKREYEEYME